MFFFLNLANIVISLIFFFHLIPWLFHERFLLIIDLYLLLKRDDSFFFVFTQKKLAGNISLWLVVFKCYLPDRIVDHLLFPIPASPIEININFFTHKMNASSLLYIGWWLLHAVANCVLQKTRRGCPTDCQTCSSCAPCLACTVSNK